MPIPAALATHQHVILARLADFCRWGEAVGRFESDPWQYMRSKLQELEAPLRGLKQGQLESAKGRFLEAARGGAPSERDLTEFREILDRYLSGGDFADASIHLDARVLADPARRDWALETLGSVEAHSFFDERKLPEERRSRTYRRLHAEIAKRLGLERLERALERKPLTSRRKRMALRRLRRDVAEYCAVLHLPASPDDTFSPFLLPRVEALVVAGLGLLERFR